MKHKHNWKRVGEIEWIITESSQKLREIVICCECETYKEIVYKKSE